MKKTVGRKQATAKPLLARWLPPKCAVELGPEWEGDELAGFITRCLQRARHIEWWISDAKLREELASLVRMMDEGIAAANSREDMLTSRELSVALDTLQAEARARALREEGHIVERDAGTIRRVASRPNEPKKKRKRYVFTPTERAAIRAEFRKTRSKVSSDKRAGELVGKAVFEGKVHDIRSGTFDAPLRFDVVLRIAGKKK